MKPQRRALLLGAAGWCAQATSRAAPPTGAPAAAPDNDGEDRVRSGRVLRFPRDHGAHLAARIEWWYATGWLGRPDAPTHGFQLTFFRSATGLAANLNSRFAPRQLLFAHAALTTLPGANGKPAGSHLHDQRIQRWSGASDAVLARAAVGDADVVLGNWSLRREGPLWRADLPAGGFRLGVTLTRTQAVLLQGDAGYSRKGPDAGQASHYYSEPQLAAAVTLQVGSNAPPVQSQGRAWLDHEWSNQLLHPQAVGWDWMGINFFDGSALTVFVLRRADGSALWAGGSFRSASGVLQVFAPAQVRLQALRKWRSPGSGADYPVHWQVDCPAGSFQVRALLDAQELDSSSSTGTIYWEGLSELTDARDLRLGLGYLEMTGYARRLQLP